MFNLALIHEAIAERIPEREAIVFRDRRVSWWELTDRSRRLADLLRGHGLGCHTERSKLENWESGQDHVGLYLRNGNEYLEGMLGAFKARAVPFNVNYRYVDDELVGLLEDADARALIFHASFAPILARIRDRLPKLALWIQVSDDSAEPLLPGALDYEQALAAATPARPAADLSPDDLYILYTGGTTGMPKAVLWRQEDIFHAALYSGAADSLEAVVERALREGPRVLTAPPFMHGAAHWVAFNMWYVGGTVIIPSNVRHLDPADVWSTIERERATALCIVGDAFGRPLADELRAGDYDVSRLRLITSGGATLSAALKRELLDRIPGLRLLDALGSSEAGTQAAQYSARGDAATSGDFALKPENLVLNADRSGIAAADSAEPGWAARRGRVPLGYYKDPRKTAETFPVIDGVRYAVPGDRARVAADGSLQLLGRDSVTINTGGEKVFAEEVERALKHHPGVYDAVVVPTPHERWGQQVTALVVLREGRGISAGELIDSSRDQIAAFKLPRRVIFVDEIVRAPSGKADYRWAKSRALESLDADV
jgi:acyl-CoA synthetase (AMP-forming)/AMP-acid ligase II